MPDDLKEFYSKTLMISVFLAHSYDRDKGGSPKPINKLRRQIRLSLVKDTKHWREEMLEVSKAVDMAWHDTKRTIDKDNPINIQLSMAMSILYGTMDTNQFQHKWFSERTFLAAARSLAYGCDSTKDEEDTYGLVDKFLDRIDYPRESQFAKRIRLAKKIKEQNDILEGN